MSVRTPVGSFVAQLKGRRGHGTRGARCACRAGRGEIAGEEVNEVVLGRVLLAGLGRNPLQVRRKLLAESEHRYRGGVDSRPVARASGQCRHSNEFSSAANCPRAVLAKSVPRCPRGLIQLVPTRARAAPHRGPRGVPHAGVRARGGRRVRPPRLAAPRPGPGSGAGRRRRGPTRPPARLRRVPGAPGRAALGELVMELLGGAGDEVEGHRELPVWLQSVRSTPCGVQPPSGVAVCLIVNGRLRLKSARGNRIDDGMASFSAKASGSMFVPARPNRPTGSGMSLVAQALSGSSLSLTKAFWRKLPARVAPVPDGELHQRAVAHHRPGAVDGLRRPTRHRLRPGVGIDPVDQRRHDRRRSSCRRGAGPWSCSGRSRRARKASGARRRFSRRA